MRVAALLLIAACTHHAPVAEVGEVRGDVTVETTDHREIDAVASAGADGSLALRTIDNRPIDLGYVKELRDEHTLRGALEGGGIGAGIGILGGAILGYAGGDDPECDHCYFATSAKGKAMIGAVVFGVIGGLIGLAVGTVHGSTTIYEF